MTAHFKRIVAYLALLLAISLSPMPVGAETSVIEAERKKSAAAESAAPASTEKVYVGERISLDFQNTDIHEIVEFISEASGKKIVVSNEVQAALSIRLQDVPWDQALDVVISSNNLEADESSDGVLVIYTQETFQMIRKGRALMAEYQRGGGRDGTSAKGVFTAKYVPVDIVSAEMGKFKSERGKILVFGNDIYIADKPEAIKAMAEAFKRIDRMKILIESYIVESSADFVEHFGFKKADVQPGVILDFGEGARLNVIVISNDDAKLSHTFGASKDPVWPRSIPSSRRIMTDNNQEVSIEHFKTRPRCNSGGQASTSTAANVHLKDWKVELRIKPHVEENGNDVTLDISLTREISQFDDSNGSPPDDREARARITVKNGETLAIGGVFLDDLKAEPQRGNASSHFGGDLNASAGKDLLPRPLTANGQTSEPIVLLKDWADLYDYQPVGGKNTELMIFFTVNIVPMVI